MFHPQLAPDYFLFNIICDPGSFAFLKNADGKGHGNRF